MRKKMSKCVLVALFVAVISFCTVISSSAGAKDSSEQEGLVIPPDKCIFIDTHTNTKGVGDVGPQLMIDFPTYSFGNGKLLSWIQVPGYDQNTKVLVGRGSSLSGTAGGGASTMLSAYDTDNEENLFYFDADATVHYYYKGDWRTVKVGETWTETVERSPNTGDGKLIDTNTIKNYGFVDRIDIIMPTPRVTPPPPTPTTPATPTPVVYTGNFYNISGYIKPSFNTTDTNSKSGFAVEVAGLGKSTTTDENGFFRIEGIPVNSEGYSLKISKKCYLLRTVEFRSGGEDIQFDEENMPISMWVGDIVMDEAINIVDIMEIAKSYNSFSGDAKYNKDVDINKDGAVNIQDIMIVAANFNKVSSNYNNNEIILLRKMKLHIGNITRMIFKENLSEGLKWDYEIENENIIKFESGYIEELVAGDPFANHVWRFTAVAEGESYLTFKSSLGQIEKYLIIVSNPLSSSTPSP
jgi:predicted secreted protein